MVVRHAACVHMLASTVQQLIIQDDSFTTPDRSEQNGDMECTASLRCQDAFPYDNVDVQDIAKQVTPPRCLMSISTTSGATNTPRMSYVYRIARGTMENLHANVSRLNVLRNAVSAQVMHGLC